MHRFWGSIVGPLLEIVRPRVIVEVGSDYGPNTRELLEFCRRRDARLHVIDPMPKYDVAEWQDRHGEHAVFHRALSLDALPEIGRFDAVLIDGDHNWYTVFNELELVRELCEKASRNFPLVVLHDVGWPYGRRDGYYAYEAIPEAYRQPHARRGMLPGSADLVEGGGLNRGFPNAIREGGPRNGVLTAVEDFLARAGRAGQAIDLTVIPGLHGLGILVPRHLPEQNEKLPEFLASLQLSPAMARHVERVEEAHLKAEIKRQEFGVELKRLEAGRKRQALGPPGGPETEKPGEARGADENLRQRLRRARQRNRKLAEQVERLKDQLRALRDG